MTLRVVQWNTGIVGTSAVRAMLRHPGLEVVGCFAYAEEKRGEDVGTLCGVDPLGVKASGDEAERGAEAAVPPPTASTAPGLAS